MEATPLSLTPANFLGTIKLIRRESNISFLENKLHILRATPYYTNKTAAIVFLFFFFFSRRRARGGRISSLAKMKRDGDRHRERKMKMDDGERERRKGRQYRIKRGLRDMNNSGCVKMSQNRDSTRGGGAFSSLKSIKSSKRADSPRIKENICRLSIKLPISPSSKMAENREGAKNQLFIRHNFSCCVYN